MDLSGLPPVSTDIVAPPQPLAPNAPAAPFAAAVAQVKTMGGADSRRSYFFCCSAEEEANGQARSKAAGRNHHR
jgi:hypothetical protein